MADPGRTTASHHSRPRRTSGAPPFHASRLYELVGVERRCDELSRLLRNHVQAERPPVVGAMRVSCSDESEQESIDGFHRQFVRFMLPSMKFSFKSTFRLANLGGRYQWGAVRLAEDHFAFADGAQDWKCIVGKINAHVSVVQEPDGPRFGRMPRYAGESTYCGALDAVLGGSTAPFARALAEDLDLECVGRLATLSDPKKVDPAERNLLAAVVSARLQARRAMMDLQDHEPRTPTLYLILPCVTLNRPGHDTEILCGIYTADRRGDEPHDEYCGLGARPERMRVSRSGPLAIDDPGRERPREARDHRRLVREAWEARERTPEPSGELADELEKARQRKTGAAFAKAGLKTLLAVLMELSPIPAAVLLFGEGLVHMHNASQAHRLSREASNDRVARRMLGEIQGEIDSLSPERAEHLIQLLLAEYAR